MEGLTTTNALMREDLSVTKKALAKTIEENKSLLLQLEVTKSKNAAEEAAAAAATVVAQKINYDVSCIILHKSNSWCNAHSQKLK